MNGGYIMIDCKKLNLLSQSTQTISGLYANCKTAQESGKPIFANNLEYGENIPLSPVHVFAKNDGSENEYIVLTASVLQVWVKNDDTVTIVNLAPANNTKTNVKKG